MPVEEKDFVQLSYTGRVKSSGKVFDTTDGELAKKEHLHQADAHYGPRTICVGQRQLITGLDKALLGKEIGAAFTIDILPEEAFGMKDPKRIEIVQTSLLMKQKIQPYPGLQVQVPGMVGTIRTVSAGRTTIDFNHPLAGKELTYEVKVLKLVEDDREKLKALLLNLLNVSEKEAKLDSEGKKVKIKFLGNVLPDQLKQTFKSRVKDLIPALELEFA